MKLIVLTATLLYFPGLFFAQTEVDSTQADVIRMQQFKINLLPTFGGRVDISWEKGVGSNQSFDLGLNIIGLSSKNKYEDPKGVILHVGYKLFYHHSETNDEKFHPLNGLYFEPLIMTGYTQKNHEYFEPTDDPPGGMIKREKIRSTKYLAAFINFGKQYILFNRISLDFTAGFGVGTYTNRRDTNVQRETTVSTEPRRFGFMIFGSNNYLNLKIDTPLAFNAGIRLGYVFN